MLIELLIQLVWFLFHDLKWKKNSPSVKNKTAMLVKIAMFGFLLYFQAKGNSSLLDKVFH